MASPRLHTALRRRAPAFVALILAAGCGVKRVPRRVPGSDITLPPPTSTWLLESLLQCGDQVVTPQQKEGKCRAATGDTVPDTRGPTPPAKVP